MNDPADGVLVQQTLDGSREAFAELVRRYQDYAYGTAIGMLSDFDLARDVVQEAFLCAYADLHSLQDAANFGGWLYGIVRNMARRALRELARVRALAADMAGARGTVDPSPGPDELAVKQEQRRIVRQALMRLRQPNREAISLFYVDGLTYADIADYLGVSQATVLGRLQRGRAELKKELLTMVEDAFAKEHLPADFSGEVTRLLERALASGREREAAVSRLAEIGGPAVEPLCEALGDQRQVARRVAARALCRIGDSRAIGPIFRLVCAGDYWIGNDVFRTGQVLGIPGVREELLRLAAGGSSAERYWVIQALGHASSDTEVCDQLDAVFRNTEEETDIRCSALGALCRLRPDRTAEYVEHGLRDPAVRRLSGYAWWMALKGGIVPPLDLCLRGLRRDVAPNGRYMAGLLALRHGEAGIKALEAVLRSGPPDEQESAAVALAHKAHAEAFDVLVEALRRSGHERKWGRIMIRETVRRYGPRLAEWAHAGRPDVSDSPELSWALVQWRLAAGTATPADLLHEGPPTLRADALRKLVARSGADALLELRCCLAGGTPAKLAREAFRQMYRLGEAAMPVALDMVESPQWTERKAAVCLLRRWGRLGPEQKARAAADPHVAVRHAAQWAPAYVEAARAGHPKWRRKVGGGQG